MHKGLTVESHILAILCQKMAPHITTSVACIIHFKIYISSLCKHHTYIEGQIKYVPCFQRKAAHSTASVLLLIHLWYDPRTRRLARGSSDPELNRRPERIWKIEMIITNGRWTTLYLTLNTYIGTKLLIFSFRSNLVYIFNSIKCCKL